MQIISQSSEHTTALGMQLATLLQAGDVLCLSGDLGAGKTLFVQGITAGLALDDQATSPTFTVLNVYEGPIRVYHFDLYRLEWPEQLDDIGFTEFIYGDGIAIIEWPDKFPHYMPEEALRIDITKAGDSMRLFAVTACGTRYQQLYEELRKLATGY